MCVRACVRVCVFVHAWFALQVCVCVQARMCIAHTYTLTSFSGDTAATLLTCMEDEAGDEAGAWAEEGVCIVAKPLGCRLIPVRVKGAFSSDGGEGGREKTSRAEERSEEGGGGEKGEGRREGPFPASYLHVCPKSLNHSQQDGTWQTLILLRISHKSISSLSILISEQFY